MVRLLRFVAMLLLAILLPVQGLAGACAQICAATQQQQPSPPTAMHHGDAASHEDCEKSSIGDGKCCQAHAFVAAQPGTLSTFEPEAAERHSFVAHWTNFIAQEPYPPPIGVPPAA